jgi:peptidoglycan/xylan/chitin deacetylase (PgdA/CDA1 family)
MNAICLLYANLPLKKKIPGYLEALQDLLQLEHDHQARATFFFRTVTCPTRDILKTLHGDGHEIAYHADRIATFQDFDKDLSFIEQETCQRGHVRGFTKHGYARFRSGGAWDEGKMIQFAKMAGLKYIAQGVRHLDWSLPRVIDGVCVFGHHRTVKDCGLDEMLHYIDSSDMPLLLLHPEDLFIDGVKEKFVKILKFAQAIPVIDAIRLVG